MIKLLASFLVLALATSVMGQANHYEKIQANQYRPQYRPYNRYSNRVYNQGYRPYQRPLETTTSSPSVYMPGNGPDMPVASSTFPPQFGLGVSYTNLGTALPTTSTANPAAAWYQNWLNSLPDAVKRLYGVTTTVAPQGLVGRRRRALSQSSRRRRSAEEDLASTTEGLEHHHKHHKHHHEHSSPAPEDASVSPQGLSETHVKRSAEEEEGLLHHHKHGHHDHEDASPAPEVEASTAQELSSTPRVKRSVEEDVSTQASENSTDSAVVVIYANNSSPHESAASPNSTSIP